MSEHSDRLAAIADAAFDHDGGFERFGPNNFWMRFLVFLNDLSLYLLRRSIPGGRRARKAIAPLIHLYRELGIARPDILAFLEESAIELADVGARCPQPMPWCDERIPEQAMHIPNMLEPEAMRYYTWLGRTLESAGEIVELGCWMGGSTACLSGGLRQNPQHRKLHVFDGFIWRDWMSRYTTDAALPERFRDGDCFIDAFLEYCAPFRGLLDVTQGRIPFDGDDGSLAPIRWHGEAIGAIIVDHSDRYEANVQAWEAFARYFVPGETIVVFNQYGNLRAEELRRFCRDRKGELVLLHHLACSGRAFRFMGAS